MACLEPVPSPCWREPGTESAPLQSWAAGQNRCERFVNIWSLFPINLGLLGPSRSCKAFDKGLETILRLLFRADFTRKLVEVLSQLLISADSYRSSWALEPVKSKVERMHPRVKGLKRDRCPGLTGLLLGQNTRYVFFLLLQPKTSKPRRLIFITKETKGEVWLSPSMSLGHRHVTMKFSAQAIWR